MTVRRGLAALPASAALALLVSAAFGIAGSSPTAQPYARTPRLYVGG